MLPIDHRVSWFKVITFWIFFSTSVLASRTDRLAEIRKRQLHNSISSIASSHLATRTAPPVAITSSASSLNAAIHKHDNTSQAQVAQAQALVAQSLQEVSASNKARVENPLRNNYGSQDPASKKFRRDNIPALSISPEVAAAAALVAEIEAIAAYKNGTLYRDYSSVENKRKNNPELKKDKRQTTSPWWLESIDHLGTQPYGNDPGYKVFRNVMKDYNATGNGVTDDTAAINKAISDGNRCGAGCNSSSVKGALVYFPSGRYLVSGSLISYYNTQLVGDANDPPTLVASSSFQGLGVIDTDYYIPGDNGAEWYINQANFYRQIRNFNIDISATTAYAVCGLHYQVAQATSLYNIAFIQSTSSTTTQQGIFTENGSGGFLSNLIFENGAFGIYGGNQQFTALSLIFTNCRTAIQLIWDWGWIWQGISISGASVGISLLGQDGVTRGTGSLLVQDSTFSSTTTAVLMAPPISGPAEGSTGITFDNVAFTGVTSAIADSSGKTWLAGSVGSVDAFTLGNAYFSSPNNTFTDGTIFKAPRVSSLTTASAGLPKQIYYTQPKPQYDSFNYQDVIQMKWFTPGNGVTDDTTLFQEVITAFASSDFIIFIDAGSYVLSKTITIPSGAVIVGECWAQLVASGVAFQDATNPYPLFQVGTAGGETGNVQIQDLLFTTVGPSAGLIAVEWNMNAAARGSAAMWDCHVRIGGALGSNMQVAQCPALTSGAVNPNCIAGSLMMHITSGASGYFENVWLWTADHDIDNLLNTQVSVYNARGLLVESSNPVWLYGTASEHSVFYQYQFYQASNILAAMIQTESPYYQPNPAPPAPFTNAINAFDSDPQLQYCTTGVDGCDASWALRIIEVSNLTIAGAGLYSWFQDYNEACVNTKNCQQTLVQVENTLGNVYIYNLVTIGAVNMVNELSDQAIAELPAAPNINAVGYPWWTLITVIVPVAVDDGASSNGSDVTIDPSIWSSTAPVVGCQPPCTLIIPPYPLSTPSTITWPTLTTTVISSSKSIIVTITTTIKIPKVTITAISFWPITVGPDDPPTATFSPVQSIQPPSTVITFSSNVITFSPSQYPQNGVPTSSTTSSSTLVPVFFTTKHPVTVQPMPTISITSPPPYVPQVTYSSGKPYPTCSHALGCGSNDCGLFGCGHQCGIFGCDGGCGIFGCGGGCGLFGCGGSCDFLLGCTGGCPLSECGGLGCETPNCGYGDDNPEQESSTCISTTYSDCSTICSTAPSTCVSTCTSYTGCEATATSGVTTITGEAPFAFVNLEVGWITSTPAASAVNSVASVWSSMLLSAYGPGAVSITYTSMTSGPSSQPTTTSKPPPTTTPPTTTKAPTPPATPSATCSAIANIADTDVYIWTNYVTDNGFDLKMDETDDCPGLASWAVQAVSTSFTDSSGHTWVANQEFTFNLQVTHPQVLVCVQRAIVAAGGPSNTPQCNFVPAINPPKRREFDEIWVENNWKF